MSSTELLLGMEEPEGIVVAVEREVVVKKVMSPESERLDYGVELPIIVRVSRLGLA